MFLPVIPSSRRLSTLNNNIHVWTFNAKPSSGKVVAVFFYQGKRIYPDMLKGAL